MANDLNGMKPETPTKAELIAERDEAWGNREILFQANKATEKERDELREDLRFADGALADTRNKLFTLEAERDDLREKVDRLSFLISARGEPYTWPAAQVILEKERDELRAQLEAVRDIARKTKVPKSGMIVTPRSPQQAIREILDILQPDSGKDGG